MTHKTPMTNAEWIEIVAATVTEVACKHSDHAAATWAEDFATRLSVESPRALAAVRAVQKERWTRRPLLPIEAVDDLFTDLAPTKRK